MYLGKGTPTMPTEIKHPKLNFSYTVIAMNEIDVDLFLNSDNPHEIVLAVLCKYTRRQAPKIIKQILEKLRKKTQNERELHEYVTDLEILYYALCIGHIWKVVNCIENQATITKN